MNNREAGKYDPDINNHPPTCTCAECTSRRLGKKQSAWSKLGSHLSINRTEEPPPPTLERHTATKDNKRTLGWLLPAVLVFSCTFIGLGISIFAHTFIPLYLLLGFSLIFSIEKWLHYLTRKYRYVGRLYRLSLNLTILCLLGLAVWSGVKLFSQQYFSTSLIGSLIFLAELTLFVWMWRVVSKNSWRWPSMKLIVFVLLIVFIVLAFAGVSPMAEWKDKAIDKITTTWTNWQEEQEGNKATEGNDEGEISGTTTPARESTAIPINNFEIVFNEYRKSYGLSPLEFTSDLNRTAELRLEELQTNYSHFIARGYNRHLAENICMISFGPLSDQAAFNTWKSSPGHNANMLNPSYKYTGYANGGGRAVQVFTEYPTINGEPQLPPGWHW